MRTYTVTLLNSTGNAIHSGTVNCPSSAEAGAAMFNEMKKTMTMERLENIALDVDGFLVRRALPEQVPG